MSEFLGQPVSAKQDDPFTDQTVCVYTPEKNDMGLVERVVMKVEWGSGQASAMGMGIAARAEPGIAASADELGDGAKQIGPAL